MPRTHNRTDQVICHRLLVEQFYQDKWHETLVYGPYFTVGPARATIHGAENRYSDQYEKGIRRSRVQKQEVVTVEVVHREGRAFDLYHEIQWVDVA